MAELTETDRKVLALFDPLGTHDPCLRSCTEIGERLYGGVRKRQCYARIGGKLAKRLIRMGLLVEARRSGRRVFARTRSDVR
jgi:hypothetical protein